MKLNYKRTLLVGFAFFLICAFWQAYDTIIPKILTDKFGLSQTISGVIMALDNVLALFMLPFFGALSDKAHARMGRRTPFILVGTILSVAALLLLAVPDGIQRNNLADVSATEGAAYEEALETLWQANPDVRVESEAKEGEEGEEKESKSFAEIMHDVNPFRSDKKQPLQSLISHDEFVSIPADGNNKDYNNFVVPARQAYAAQVTKTSPAPLIFFMCVLLMALLSMGTFRSPAVALMPDVTVKPLRSKANAMINLMGAAGGVIVLALGMVLGTGKTANALMSYTLFFAIIAGLMLLSLAIFLWKVREPQWAQEAEDESRRMGLEMAEDEPQKGDRRLSRGERASLLLILASVVLWFMGYNAVTSKYSVYAGSVLGMDYNFTLIIANAAAIVSYLPIGILSSRFGRKKMILTGVAILAVSFFAAAFLNEKSSVIVMDILFATAGIGWATINVNSYPMVVELARGSDVGRYTGFYYTASMAAQVITPILSGVFLDIKLTTLFPYATVFVVLSFVTMLFVRHGDAKPVAKDTVLEGLGGID